MRIKYAFLGLLIVGSAASIALASVLVPTGMDSTTGQFRIASPSDTMSLPTLGSYATSSTVASTYVPQTTTVNSHALSGNVTVTASDVGLGNANNTSDANKPVSTATQTELDKKSRAYEGIMLRSNVFPIFKNVTVSSGVAVFYLTADNTSGGTALFPNGVMADSVNAFVSDATASYQMSYAFTNSNKTLTVTANKLTTANILSGVLGQSAANGAVVRVQVWGY